MHNARVKEKHKKTAAHIEAAVAYSTVRQNQEPSTDLVHSLAVRAFGVVKVVCGATLRAVDLL